MMKIYKIELDENGDYKFVLLEKALEKVSYDNKDLITKEISFEILEKIIKKADYSDESCESGGSWQSYELLNLLERAVISLKFLKQLLNDKSSIS